MRTLGRYTTSAGKGMATTSMDTPHRLTRSGRVDTHLWFDEARVHTAQLLAEWVAAVE